MIKESKNEKNNRNFKREKNFDFLGVICRGNSFFCRLLHGCLTGKEEEK